MPVDKYSFENFDMLYDGLAHYITNDNEQGHLPIFTVSSSQATFALTKIGEKEICGVRLIKTEHPRLFIREGMNDGKIQKRNMSPLNVDLFAYMNSKFVYVERHLKTQLDQLYHDVILHKCRLEMEILKNTLSMATTMPDEFAYQLMKGPGYMAVSTGEVIHVVKCVPVDVKIRRTTECYHQLPVQRGNESLFLTPRTHILLKAGTQTDCNPVIPTMYLIDNLWYKLIPIPVETETPQQLKPMTRSTWKYTSPGALAISGIYTESDLSRLREHIMFPAEKSAIMHTIARSMSGQPTNNQGISINSFFTEDMINQISESAWKRMWSSFMTFGTASAGIIGIMLLFRGIKFFIDTIIHGYALHSMYGWSLHLIGALWDSITHLLLHLANQRDPKEEEKDVTKKTDYDEAQTLSHNENEEEGEQIPLAAPRGETV